LRPIDPRRDHTRGGGGRSRTFTVVLYGDYLCHYCRGLRAVLERLRRALGEREVYVFRHFPNERAHPGAELMSLGAEAAVSRPEELGCNSDHGGELFHSSCFAVGLGHHAREHMTGGGRVQATEWVYTKGYPVLER
jgi:hypothetical protein